MVNFNILGHSIYDMVGFVGRDFVERRFRITVCRVVMYLRGTSLIQRCIGCIQIFSRLKE